MREDYLDREIRRGLQAAARHVEAPGRCRERIDERIRRAQTASSDKGQEARMKKQTWKKTLIGAAACCVLIGGTAFAAGRIVSVYSTGTRPENSSFSQMEELEETAGFSVGAVEVFSNGLRFQGVSVGDAAAQDAEGNAVSSWKQVSVVYGDDAGRTVFMDAEPAGVLKQDPAENALEERTIGGIPAWYNRVEYHMVPADYEVSPEEQRREEEDPHYTVSFGAERESTVWFSDVTFVKNGVRYVLLTPDDMSADELYGMAGEIVAAVR